VGKQSSLAETDHKKRKRAAGESEYPPLPKNNEDDPTKIKGGK